MIQIKDVTKLYPGKAAAAPDPTSRKRSEKWGTHARIFRLRLCFEFAKHNHGSR